MKKLFKKFKKAVKNLLYEQTQKNVLPEFLKHTKDKRILLISHQLTCTGSPIVLYHLARKLLDNGYSPFVLSYTGGDLTKDFKRIGVPVLIGEIYRDKPEELKKIALHFDKTIVNTIVCYSAVDVLENPIWWIHEGQTVETGFMIDYPDIERVLRKAETIFVVSEYAKAVIDKYNPKSEIIRLGTEDVAHKLAPVQKHDKIRFAHVGNVTELRAQDVIIEAVMDLDEKYLRQCEFHFYSEKRGRLYRKEKKRTKRLQNIFWDGLISNQTKKWSEFNKNDVFLIPSRDESLSLVTLEACMLKKPIATSENVGAKYMVKQGENGYVFETSNPKALKEVLIKFIEDKEKLVQMGEISRQMYEKYASYENYTKELQKIINLCGH